MIKLTEIQRTILEQAANDPENCIRSFMSHMPKSTQVKITDELLDKGMVMHTYQSPSKSAETEVSYLISNAGWAAIGKTPSERKTVTLNAECQESVDLSEVQQSILKKAADAQKTCIWSLMTEVPGDEKGTVLDGLIARGFVKFMAQFNPLKPNEKGMHYLLTDEGLAVASKI